ncbi:MAG: hypothetical protein EOP53_22755 [Sphingobacteriales bacterium]|nr:MAG: hypothetical protein EOP53_22755 [Sphingobacteriales bacterium]
MAKYDDAFWHYGGDFPEELEKEAGATHIGMFISWCIDNNLMSEMQEEDAGDDIQLVKERKMTGAEFLINNCDEKFSSAAGVPIITSPQPPPASAAAGVFTCGTIIKRVTILTHVVRKHFKTIHSIFIKCCRREMIFFGISTNTCLNRIVVYVF